MSATLLAYGYVPPGFEVLIAGGQICPGGSGGIWNLWWNVKLTDDPESWDQEITLINARQARLGQLTVHQRLIRAQMAEFCRLSPLFPQSVQILCEEIGAGRFSTSVRMGCEGRGLLNALGYDDAESLKEQRRAVLAEYGVALDTWLSGDQPETPTERKVFGFLGQPAKSKEAFARCLGSAIGSPGLPISSLKRLNESECREAPSKPRPFNCCGCDGSKEGPGGPNCQCSWSMIIDGSLLGTAAPSWTDASEFRRFTEEYILAYSCALNSWLEATSPQPIALLTDARYIGQDKGLAMAERVRGAIGVRDDVKEWLAACLLKTIRDNQRWHDRVELVDGLPESGSWLAQAV
jgi:hypothetical protein